MTTKKELENKHQSLKVFGVGLVILTLVLFVFMSVFAVEAQDYKEKYEASIELTRMLMNHSIYVHEKYNLSHEETFENFVKSEIDKELNQTGLQHG